MKGDILIINVCREKLHYLEFVKPVEDIVKKAEWGVVTKRYMDITREDIAKCSKMIICGTSLMDHEFTKHLERFSWLKSIEKPVLGICAGSQIVGLTFGGKLLHGTEIGFYSERFRTNFLGLDGAHEVYHLHHNYIDYPQLKEFEILCQSKMIVQAAKHKTKQIYVSLFHPEVRNKEVIENFCELETINY